MVSTLASRPSCPGSIHSVPFAEVKQRQYLEESGQWFENVDRTHFLQDSSNLVQYYNKSNYKMKILAER